MKDTVVIEEYAKKASRRKGNLSRYGTVALFLAPFILAFIIFFVFPLFYGIYISLTNFKFATPGAEIKFNDFRWYKTLLSTVNPISGKENLYSNAFVRAFLHSLIFSVIMVPIAVLVPLGLAILVNYKPPGYKVFRCLVYLPSIVPLTAVGCVFVLLFKDRGIFGYNGFFGVNTQWFASSFLKVVYKGKDAIVTWDFGNPVTYTVKNCLNYYFATERVQINFTKAWLPIFLMCFWGGWGGNFIILNAGLQNVPKNLYEAADIDGAGKWKQVTAITLSGIKPQLVLCLFTTIIGYLGLYGQNYVLSLGGPGVSYLTGIPGGGATSTAIYYIQDIVANDETLRKAVYGLGAAASFVFALFVGIISGLQMFLTRDRKSGTKISEDFALWQQTK